MFEIEMIDYDLFECFFLSLWFVGADDDVEAAKESIKNKYLNAVSVKADVKKNIHPQFIYSVCKVFVRSVLFS